MGDDRESSSGRLKEFNRRLQQSQKSLRDADRAEYRRGSAYSFGFRLATDLVVGVLAGFGIGWFLDRTLGTSPWFLLVFTPLGIAAGIMNVIRAATSMEARRHLEQTTAKRPPAQDDGNDEA